jgi:hypothetical protein
MDARFRRKENLEYVAERVQKLRNCLQADVINPSSLSVGDIFFVFVFLLSEAFHFS